MLCRMLYLDEENKEPLTNRVRSPYNEIRSDFFSLFFASAVFNVVIFLLCRVLWKKIEISTVDGITVIAHLPANIVALGPSPLRVAPQTSILYTVYLFKFSSVVDKLPAGSTFSLGVPSSSVPSTSEMGV